MTNSTDIKKIKDLIEEFFKKMTINAQVNVNDISINLDEMLKEGQQNSNEKKNNIEVTVKVDEPQILIGEKGQTLGEVQRMLRSLVNKKIGNSFYLNLDINDYKKKKAEYLKELANDVADEVATKKEPKVLAPMSSYERRIVHAALSGRTDITTESQGEEPNRSIVIKIK